MMYKRNVVFLSTGKQEKGFIKIATSYIVHKASLGIYFISQNYEFSVPIYPAEDYQ